MSNIVKCIHELSIVLFDGGSIDLSELNDLCFAILQTGYVEPKIRDSLYVLFCMIGDEKFNYDSIKRLYVVVVKDAIDEYKTDILSEHMYSDVYYKIFDQKEVKS